MRRYTMLSVACLCLGPAPGFTHDWRGFEAATQADGSVRLGDLKLGPPLVWFKAGPAVFRGDAWNEEFAAAGYTNLSYLATMTDQDKPVELRRHLEITADALYVTDVIRALQPVELPLLSLGSIESGPTETLSYPVHGIRHLRVSVGASGEVDLFAPDDALRLTPREDGSLGFSRLQYGGPEGAAGLLQLQAGEPITLAAGEELFFSYAITTPRQGPVERMYVAPPWDRWELYHRFDPLRGPLALISKNGENGLVLIGPAHLSGLWLAHATAQAPEAPEDFYAKDLVLRTASVLVKQDRGDIAPRVSWPRPEAIWVRQCDVVLTLAVAASWTGDQRYLEHLSHYYRIFQGNDLRPGNICRRDERGLAIFPSDRPEEAEQGYALVTHLMALDQARAIAETLGANQGQPWRKLVQDGLERLMLDLPKFRRGEELLARAAGQEPILWEDAVRSLLHSANLVRATGDKTLRGLVRALATHCQAGAGLGQRLQDPWLWAAATSVARMGEPGLLFHLLRCNGAYVHFPPGLHYLSSLGELPLRAEGASAAGSDWVLSTDGRIFMGGTTVVDHSGAALAYDAFDPIKLPIELKALGDEPSAKAQIRVDVFGPNGLGAHLTTDTETLITVNDLAPGAPYVLSATWEMEGMVLVSNARGQIRLVVPADDEFDFWVEHAGI